MVFPISIQPRKFIDRTNDPQKLSRAIKNSGETSNSFAIASRLSKMTKFSSDVYEKRDQKVKRNKKRLINSRLRG